MVTLNKREIEAVLAEYFDGVDFTSEVEMTGKIADLRVWYKDFKPSRQVRRDLEDLIPNADNIETCRDYSSKSSYKAICSIISDYPTMYVKEGEDYIPIRLAEMINWCLFDKEL